MSDSDWAGFVLLVAFILISTISGFVSDRVITENIGGTVNDTYIKRYDDRDIFHVVIIKDNGETEIFQNRDSFWWWKYDSADIQHKITLAKNKPCRLTVTGWRWPFMSWFRNIVKYEPS